MELALNTASEDGRSIDFSRRAVELDDGFGVRLAPSDDSGTASGIVLDMAGELLGISGNLSLNLLGVVQVDGFFSFSQAVQSIVMTDGLETRVDALTFTAIDANGFVGVDLGGSSRFGFEISDLDFGLG